MFLNAQIKKHILKLFQKTSKVFFICADKINKRQQQNKGKNMHSMNVKMAKEIKRFKIDQIEKENNEYKGYIDYEKASVTRLILELKNINNSMFWLKNKSATKDELIEIMKIKKQNCINLLH